MKHTFNKSKNEGFYSEDAVSFTEINNFVIMMVGDGNGSMGIASKKFIHKGMISSEIAYTTNKYISTIVNNIVSYIYTNNYINEYILRYIISKSVPSKDEMSTGFCFCLAIIDKNENVLHTLTIGDCGCIFTDSDDFSYCESTISANGLIVEPDNSINIIPSIFPTDIENKLTYQKSNINKGTRIIVYSDGLGWNADITGKDLNLSTGRYYDVYTVNRYIRKSESYSTPVFGNIDKQLLINILKNNNNSKTIIDKIINEAFPLKRLDDFSISVYINN